MRVIAFGAEGNNTISHFLGDDIVTSRSFGDTLMAENFFRMKEYAEELFAQHDFDVVLTDRHPGFHSTELAKSFGKPICAIQHHKAHIYSVAHEHGLRDFIGIAADGLGYGEDGTIWGGEVFHNKMRIGRLEHHRQLGGDLATSKPARMLFSILSGFMKEDRVKIMMKQYFSNPEMEILLRQLNDGYNAPLTSSCGRMLDAASVLLGFCSEMTYSGEPAIRLQDNSTEPYEIEPVVKRADVLVLKTTPLFRFLVSNIDRDKSCLAATVQSYLAQGFLKITRMYNSGLPVVFSGGCAYNRIMSGIMKENGVLMNKKIEAGDQGISYGQIAYYLANSGDNDT